MNPEKLKKENFIFLLKMPQDQFLWCMEDKKCLAEIIIIEEGIL